MKGGLSSVVINKITHSMLQLEPMNLTIKYLLSFFLGNHTINYKFNMTTRIGKWKARREGKEVMHIRLVESMCRSIDDFQTPLRWNQIIEEIVARSSMLTRGLWWEKHEELGLGEARNSPRKSTSLAETSFTSHIHINQVDNLLPTTLPRVFSISM
jgi:hypothetical protein